MIPPVSMGLGEVIVTSTIYVIMSILVATGIKNSIELQRERLNLEGDTKSHVIVQTREKLREDLSKHKSRPTLPEKAS